MDLTVPRPGMPCPEPTPTDSRYTRIPRALHDLAKTPREYELMAALLEFRWFPSSPIIPSVKTLAEKLRCSSRTVRRTVAALETRGLLEREERRAPDDRQMSNAYILCGPLLALVTAVEATADQESSQPWQGRRTHVAGERNSGNYQNRSRRPERQDYATKDYSMTRYGPLRGH